MSINTSMAQTKFNVTYAPNRNVKHIVIHNTGTIAPPQNSCMYFGRADRNASADFFIGQDGDTWQFNADIKNYYSWHCGDGKGKYGITNAESIGIEVVSDGCEFTKAQKDAVRELIAYLENIFGECQIVRHYDASRKICPAYYIDEKRWNDLLDYISSVPTPQHSGNVLYRVQVGAFSVKEYAEIYLEKVKNSGFSNAFITRVDNLYKIQVGAFSVKSNAENMLKEVKSKGFDAFITTVNGTPTNTTTAPQNTTPQLKSNTEIAKEIWTGKCSDSRWSNWGSGEVRKQRLTEAGYDWKVVQSEIDRLYG